MEDLLYIIEDIPKITQHTVNNCLIYNLGSDHNNEVEDRYKSGE